MHQHLRLDHGTQTRDCRVQVNDLQCKALRQHPG